MRPLQSWLDEYGESHQNGFNKKVHFICVPLIFFSVLGLLASIPLPHFYWNSDGYYFHLGTLALVLGLLFYLRLSYTMFLGITLFGLLCLEIIQQLHSAGISLFISSLVIFVLAWIGQFYGHKVEGKKPSFLKDLQFLLIGPAWIIAFLYKKIGLRY
jgi:uncharacterized membrane protein YGL010W